MNFQVEYAPSKAECGCVNTVDFLGILENENMTPRARIIALQKAMVELGGEQGDCYPLEHRFAPGTYARTIRMPAGSLVIGKIHKFACVNIVTKGKATVWTEYGKKEIKTGDIWISDPATQRVVLNHEDTEWTTIHQNPDNLSDPYILEDQIISVSIIGTEL